MAIKLPGQGVPKWHELRDRIGSERRTSYDGGPAGSAPAHAAKPSLKLAPEPGTAAPAPTTDPKDREAAPAPSSTVASTVVLKALVRFPEPGQSARYDEAVAHYGEKRALQMTLRSALAAYDSALRAGAVSEALLAYPTRPGGIRVSRAMTSAGFAKAAALIDPLDMMPPATLAGDICRNAIVWFFART
ncbi:VirC2 family conjugal transfer protein [Acuticoccus sp. M5D2P5]|uniref:VirC2 family conjugal transfer protein n=1 Tax=Acuticoccus kalidii TaxID=2910977 RepID=UPI001F42996B|nr:VirC2 family conjugal transfer protein [Acuticoccus kalidii]MCF3931799.1 VirC2 family conjugal transfer protein [Acuticoccus kalidii]